MRKIRRIANPFLIAFLSATLLCGQAVPQQYTSSDSLAMRMADGITAEDMKDIVYTLASDEFEGRETGTEGNVKAAQYIAEKFRQAGVEKCPATGSYFQEVLFARVGWELAEVQLGNKNLDHLKDFLVHPEYFPLDSLTLSEENVLFLGYGIDDEVYSDYKGNDAKGKVILIYKGEPFDEEGNSLITGSATASDWSKNLDLKLKAAQANGVKTVLILQDRLKEKAGRMLRYILGGMTVMGDGIPENREYAPYIEISPAMAESLMGKKKEKVIRTRDKVGRKGKVKAIKLPQSLNVKIIKERKITPGSNVLAYIEGIDPEKKHELVIITAHYDHLGKRGDNTYYGADDNASGTSAVIEIAGAFQEAKNKGTGPARSVLCMLVTGEEKGLLGSQYYAENPLFPLENTIANVNIDMIGRVDEKHADNPMYTYVIGADRLSLDLHEINETMNSKFLGLELDYTFNAEDDPNQFYYRSDHYNFAKNGIPAIFFFSGVHEDYHRPSDTPDKLMFDKSESIARLAFHTAWELANRKERIRLKASP